MELITDEQGLVLVGDGMELRGDFTRMLPRLKQSNLEREFLVKASKLKDAGEHPLAIDATAGLGEDSLILAAAGFRVWMYEYDPVIAALLKDAVRKALENDALREIAKRMEVFEGNSIEAMKNLPVQPDLILLDPMFPESNKSAQIKKKFQLLRQLESPCSDEVDLLNAAIQAKPRKILIKRPLKGPFLGGVKPSHSYTGKAIRYDCLVYARN